MNVARLPGKVGILEVSQYLSEICQERRENLRPTSIAIVANYTLHPVERYLEYRFAISGFWPQVHFCPAGAAIQECLNPDSQLYQAKPRIILASFYLEELVRNWATSEWRAEVVWESLEPMLNSLIENSFAQVVVSTFLEPVAPLLVDAFSQRNATRQIQRLNELLCRFASKRADRMCLLDFNLMLRRLGAEGALDMRFWYLHRAPFRPGFLDLISTHILSHARQIAGHVRKCLVLDCDNTLWGGIIGEAGLGGIDLDPNQYPGSIYYKVQEQILVLQKSGVLLALCSKNNQSDVWEVFDRHPHCLIKRSDVIASRINWNNKADNLKDIASELNIGLESLVFLDDSLYECELIDRVCPEVATLNVPQKLWEYPDLLGNSLCFGERVITAEDRLKTQQYNTEAQRKESRLVATSIEEYLHTLSIEVRINRMQMEDVARVAQLTQKTNQFNLTTIRYTAGDIQALLQSSEVEVMTLSVKDKFGDMGLTNVFIGRMQNSDTMLIDTFLMSCRVFERKIEYAFLKSCIERVRALHSVRTLVAMYRKSPKNTLVENFWSECGFRETERTSNQVTYQIDCDSVRLVPFDHVRVVELYE